jgi:hypothetical protein
MTYLIFHLVGYKKYIDHPTQGQVMEDKVVVRLIDKTYESALKRAKKIVDRDQWLLAEVVEYREDA